MAITAAMVKELRESTGAGMMECKKALTETNGDMDAAVEYLRKNGIMKAEKKASRIAAEGLTRIAVKDDKTAAVVEVNSETDFVAQNEKFQAFVEAVATQAVNSDATDLDAFMAEKWNLDESKSVSDALVEITAVISEKLSIRRFEKVVAENGIVVPYVHGGGRISVIVEATTDVVNDEIKDAVKNVAMQVAALNPKFVSSEEISEEYRNHEKEILLAQAMKENEELPEGKRKPQEIIEKMLVGRLNKEFKEICLNDQVYVKAEDGKQSVGQYLAQVGKANGANLSIKRFVRFETGEGIEKKNENFAEEVAKQAAGLN
jgi:elongation factor Ts